MRGLGVFAIFFIFVFTDPSLASVTAHLDRSRIAKGETVNLTLEVGGQSQTQPNMSVLNENFEILNRSSGTQMSVMNGQMTSATTWMIMLRPKRIGKLMVPAITVGDESSKPLYIQVTEPDTAADGRVADILVETEVDRKNPYIQGMVLYTVRILAAVRIVQASLTELKLDNAIIQEMGESKVDTVTRNGVSYQMIERQYAIFPQTSGTLTLPAPVLDARVPDRQRRQQRPRSAFDNDPFFDQFLRNTPLKSVRIAGEEQTLSVKPRPRSADGSFWLPADDISMSEVWQPENGSVQVGDPVTRIITTKATGLPGAKLPDISSKSVPRIKIYPDKAKIQTTAENSMLLGQKVQRLAYVPTRAGKTTLPARTINVMSSTESLPASTPAPPLAATPIIQQADGSQVSTKNPFWFFISLGLAAIWFATVALWLLDRTRKSAAPAPNTPSLDQSGQTGTGTPRSLFLNACKKGNARDARRNLLDWASFHWSGNPPKGLDDLAARLTDTTHRDMIRTLDKAVYGSGEKTWDGLDLARTLTSLPENKDGQHAESVLPGLYQGETPKLGGIKTTWNSLLARFTRSE
jgi:hypothetical protein